MKLLYLMHFFLAHLSCIKYVFSHCVGTCYSGGLFPEPQDIFDGQYLEGYSYKNITTDDEVTCYHHCVQDCRCKVCQMKDAICELLDESKSSAKLQNASRYVYIDLRQTMYYRSSHLIPPGVCYNGCCRSQPCMNGGTCIEHCKSPKEKFTCKCSEGFSGKVCENLCSSCKEGSRQEPPQNSELETRGHK